VKVYVKTDADGLNRMLADLRSWENASVKVGPGDVLGDGTFVVTLAGWQVRKLNHYSLKDKYAPRAK
jgi:hypothetical protein